MMGRPLLMLAIWLALYGNRGALMRYRDQPPASW